MAKLINTHVSDFTSKEALQQAYDTFLLPAEILGLLGKTEKLPEKK
jgi:hypothetical protein